MSSVSFNQSIYLRVGWVVATFARHCYCWATQRACYKPVKKIPFYNHDPVRPLARGARTGPWLKQNLSPLKTKLTIGRRRQASFPILVIRGSYAIEMDVTSLLMHTEDGLVPHVIVLCVYCVDLEEG